MGLICRCDVTRSAIFLEQLEDSRFIRRTVSLFPFIEHILQCRADLGFDICPVLARQMFANFCNIFIDQVHYDFLPYANICFMVSAIVDHSRLSLVSTARPWVLMT